MEKLLLIIFSGDGSGMFSTRYGNVLRQDDEESIASENIPTQIQLLHNWDTIDDELRRIGQRLGRLGTILHQDQFAH